MKQYLGLVQAILDDGVKTNYPKYYPLVEPIKGLESKDE